MTDFKYHQHLGAVAQQDILEVTVKDKSYGASWKKRGGIGAFMMLARKWDRLENILSLRGYDIFDCIMTQPGGEDGSVLAEIRDLRRYLLLVEAEMVERGTVKTATPPPVPLDDSNKHAERANVISGDQPPADYKYEEK